MIDDIYLDFAINSTVTLLNLELNEINQYKTPKKKCKILIDFCNIISSMVCENTKKSKLAGADEVFPIIVYTLIKGNINKLKSNINFIRHFRHSTRLESEDDYFCTTVSSAIEFIDNLTYQNLNLTEEEFDNLHEDTQRKEVIRKYNNCFSVVNSK